MADPAKRISAGQRLSFSRRSLKAGAGRQASDFDTI
jgi:hypothetical protein